MYKETIGALAKLGLNANQTEVVLGIISKAEEEARKQYTYPDPDKEEFLIIGVNKELIGGELIQSGLSASKVTEIIDIIIKRIKEVLRGCIEADPNNKNKDVDRRQ